MQVTGISGLVAEYIVAIDVTRVRFPAAAYHQINRWAGGDGVSRVVGAGNPPSPLEVLVISHPPVRTHYT